MSWSDRIEFDLSQRLKTKTEAGDGDEVKTPRKKNKKRAALASLFFPGLGQLYNRHWGKGILFFAIGVVCAVYLFYYITGYLIFTPVMIISLFWAYNVYDAFSKAEGDHEDEGSMMLRKSKRRS